jgi:signal transduction histidine kinase
VSDGDAQGRAGDPEELRAEWLRLFVHDLNNPLTAIRILAEVARDDAPNEELRQDLLDILEATDMAAALIDSVSSMSRPSGRESYTWFPFDLVPVLRAAADRASLRRQLRLELPDSLRISGDRAALQRAFSDIFLNARRLGLR